MRIPGLSRRPGAAIGMFSAGALVLAGCLLSMTAEAQQRFLLQGIFDAELHDTDADSLLLSRNDGDLSALGRLQLWTAFQLTPGLQIYALGEAESDDSSGERETEAELEQLALRYTSQSSNYYFIEAGRILSPLFAYSNYHLSTQNPLIGQPPIYSSSYPEGIQAAGSSGKLDYRAAWVNEPDFNHYYIPIYPSSALRPVLGFGVTPIQALRFGLSYTKGPYLNRRLEAYLPPGNGWKDFDQSILGFDFQFSRGYLELKGQLVVSRYEIPFQPQRSDDTSWYVELKYTWTPRLYGAVRFGVNRATFIRHAGESSWKASEQKFRDLEVGLGYRFSPNTLLKFAYRGDHWDRESYAGYPIADGHSFSLQLSHFFDLGSRLVP